MLTLTIFLIFFKATKEPEQVEIAPPAEEPVKRTSRRGKSEPEKTTSKRKASPSPVKEEQVSPPKKARATRGKAAPTKTTQTESPVKTPSPAKVDTPVSPKPKRGRATRAKTVPAAKASPEKPTTSTKKGRGGKKAAAEKVKVLLNHNIPFSSLLPLTIIFFIGNQRA